MRRALVMLFLCGCQSDVVISLEGLLLDGPSVDSAPLSGATVTVREGDGASYSEGFSQSDGRFAVDAPGGQNIFLEVSGEGLVRSSFTGVAGMAPIQPIEDGRVFGFQDDELENWKTAFSGCPGSDDTGAAVVGEIRLFGFADQDTGEEPLVTTGFASVETTDGAEFTACYLDDEGIAFSEDATKTGSSGRYAIFGLPAGLHTLKIGYEAAPGVVGEYDYFLWLPDQGLSPRFPSYVELVF